MGLCFSNCWNYLFGRRGNKEKTENEKLKKLFTELYTPPDNVIYASSPSRIPTDCITIVYETGTDSVLADNRVLKLRGYKVLTEVSGKGGSGTVYKAVNISDQTIIACKRVDIELRVEKTEKSRIEVKNELFVIQRTKHPNIVRVYDHFMIKRLNTQSVYIIMDFVENTLSTVLRSDKYSETSLDESTAQRLLAQMVSAVRYMHRKGIAHRDLKMGNILIDNSLNVLVTDFGLSVVAYRPSKGGIVLSQIYTGTAAYMAPEVVKCLQDKSVPYDPFKADIWSLGIILCCMINRTFPYLYKNKTVINRLKEMKTKKFPIVSRHTPSNMSDNYFDIQKKLLEFDVKKRITTEKLAEHPWIRDQIKLIKEE